MGGHFPGGSFPGESLMGGNISGGNSPRGEGRFSYNHFLHIMYLFSFFKKLSVNIIRLSAKKIYTLNL